MRTRTQATIITIVVSIIMFMLTPIVWPANLAGHAAPTGNQVVLLMIVNAIESIAFGLGLCFVLYGWRWVARASQQKYWLRLATYVSIAWSLMSWWIHDGLHMTNGDNMARLIKIEYGFHVTLVISAIIIAHHFFDVIKGGKHAEI